MEALLTALKAAAEPTRLRLLVLCAHSDLTVSDLTQILGQSQPRISRHLKLLVEAGLLDRIREGNWAYFRLAPHGRRAQLVQTLVDSLPEDDPMLALDLKRLEEIQQARAERAQDYFRRNAVRWDSIRALYVDEIEVERALLELLPPGGVGEYLDVGTGTGRILATLAPSVGRGIGVDLSREMLAMARVNLERAGLRNCELRQADMHQLPLASDSVDLVTFHQALHYGATPGAAIAEASRVLRPGGLLVVADFAAHDLDHLRLEHAHRWLGFRDADMARWFHEAGLEPGRTLQLPGDPLTVVLWSARRAGAASAAPTSHSRH
jgi:ArsR family transcriptional regulator